MAVKVKNTGIEALEAAEGGLHTGHFAHFALDVLVLEALFNVFAEVVDQVLLETVDDGLLKTNFALKRLHVFMVKFY